MGATPICAWRECTAALTTIAAPVKNYKAAARKVAQIQHGWVKPPEGKVIEKVYFTLNL
jgi:hypothetical protein